jgi:hypothetical protein
VKVKQHQKLGVVEVYFHHLAPRRVCTGLVQEMRSLSLDIDIASCPFPLSAFVRVGTLFFFTGVFVFLLYRGE